MFESLLLSLRESLEAALVIGIILIYLHQTQKSTLTRYVWIGAIAGLAIAIIGGWTSYALAQELSGEAEEIFEGTMMLLSAGLIAYFVVWLGSQSTHMTSGIQSKVDAKGSAWGLAILAFVSVFREGLELSVFTLTKISESALDVALGTGLGLGLAIALAVVVFKSSLRLNLKLIFKGLGIVLIFIGAEMFAEGILEFVHVDEIVEYILLGVYLLPALYILFKSDLTQALRHK